MKNNIKMKSIFIGICFLFLVGVSGCHDYERKGDVTSEITLNERDLNLFVGDMIQLKASPVGLDFRWASDNPQVAVVDGNGLVQVVGDGITDIIVSAGSMRTSISISGATKIPMLDLRLIDPVTGLVISELQLNVRTAKTIIANIWPQNANDASLVVWRSSAAHIASVTDGGSIVGISPGEATIECKVNETVKEITVTVR